MAAQDPTRARILEAAGEEFAEHGFEQSRIRAICEKAGANVAAANYHFGDKRQLYVAAVLEAHRCGAGPEPPPAEAPGAPGEGLRRFIRHFLSNVLAVSRDETWHSTLMYREMMRPTEACEALVRESIRPRFDRLRAILRAACPDADEKRLHALAFTVIGQCLHYKTARAVSERLVGREAYEALDVDYLTDHIARVCLAAVGLVPPLFEVGCGAATKAALPTRSRP